MPSLNSHSPSPPRPKRRVLVASALLNLGLVVALAVKLIDRHTVPEGIDPKAQRSTGESNRPSSSIPPPPPENALTNIARFRWSELESRDLRVYLANLRAVGCPEPTIRHILIAAIEDLYRRRNAEAGVEANFWATGTAGGRPGDETASGGVDR